MILCDTGALVALLNAGDAAHTRCVQAAQQLPPEPFLMTHACFVEAMYFLGQLGGFPLQERLWSLWQNGKLLLHCPTDAELSRIRVLMEKYRDVPMDLADATIVAAAEMKGIRTVFTIDADFYIYRLHNREPFVVVPG
ncbi:MAG: PIN domain-containing protein [Armatimonadota bacterium]|nr:PIN domain-containing protein [Armatimonadota bacterium]